MDLTELTSHDRILGSSEPLSFIDEHCDSFMVSTVSRSWKAGDSDTVKRLAFL